jgi:hypothetical protein
MADGKFSDVSNAEFAEKCRVALEKSFGTDIPMPKSCNKKASK